MKHSTRSSKSKESPNIKAPAYFKVFYIDKTLLTCANSNLRLQRFYHPGKNSFAWFLTQGDCNMLEVVEFSEPRRSWLINSDVCSNGKIYMTTPIDITFLVLHQIRKHCTNKAMELDNIHDDEDPSVKLLMTNFIDKASLNCITNKKSVGDMNFYTYNGSKALSWLSIKTKNLAEFLKSMGIHCGRSALSQNYMRSEKAAEEPVQNSDYLRMACDIIGGYLDITLYDELSKYLNIPVDVKTDVDEKDKNGKRKSLNSLKAVKNKKIKVDENILADTESATESLKNNSLLNESLDDVKSEEKRIYGSAPPEIPKPTFVKERVLTAKEKKLAIGAKGTKSISSFFKK